MSGAGTTREMRDLHGALTAALADRVKEAKTSPEKPLTAAEVAAIAKFLKDNGITAVLENSQDGRELVGSFPFPGAEADA